MYTEKEIEQLALQASENAVKHFDNALSCAESVLLAVLDLGISDFPKETVALASGCGGGLGDTRHTCGACIGACMAMGTIKGRKNPYDVDSIEGRKEVMHRPGDGLYPQFGELVLDIMRRYGTCECRDFRIRFDETTEEGAKARRAACVDLVRFCAAEAVRHALK